MRHSLEGEGTFGKVHLSQFSTVLSDYKWYVVSRNLFTKFSESSHAPNSEVRPSGRKAERKYKKMRRNGESRSRKLPRCKLKENEFLFCLGNEDKM